jgi:hypothetical protein
MRNEIADSPNYLSLTKVNKAPAVTAGPFALRDWGLISNSDLSKKFFVDLWDEFAQQKIRIDGTYRLDNNKRIIAFIPNFPFLSNETYKANLDINLNCRKDSLSSIRATLEFGKNRSDEPLTYVKKIYPTALYWPENILRFYIEFSAPIREDQALEHIRLFDANGMEQEGVFLDTARELWSTDKKQLTVLFDPGRVKKGLFAHTHYGRALKVGEQYSLMIDQNMLDARGRNLAQSFTKHFSAIDEVVAPLDPNDWKLIAPKVSTFQSLTLIFPNSLDRFLLELCINILGSDFSVLSGKVSIKKKETIWSFIPKLPWQRYAYTIRINNRLEDSSGNNLNESFDLPLENKRNVGFSSYIDKTFTPI